MLSGGILSVFLCWGSEIRSSPHPPELSPSPGWEAGSCWSPVRSGSSVMRQRAAGNEDGAPVPASPCSPRRGKKKLVERLCDRYIPKKMCWSQQRWVNFLLVRYLTVHNASAQFAYGPELVPVTGLMAFTTAPSAVRAQQLHTNVAVMWCWAECC